MLYSSVQLHNIKELMYLELRTIVSEQAGKNFGHFKIDHSCSNNHEAMNLILLAMSDENVISEMNRYIQENIE